MNAPVGTVCEYDYRWEIESGYEIVNRFMAATRSKKLCTEEDAGFDAVVGNPPYGANFTNQEQEYLDKAYVTRGVEFDSYSFFLENGIDLSRKLDKLGYIIPTMWTNLENNKPLREYILQNTSISEIIKCGKVFNSGGQQPLRFVYFAFACLLYRFGTWLICWYKSK